jgi:phosphoribosylaminoimidazole-succinocarboxamide synthase
MIQGKVREIYELEDGRLVIVTTDRISAFDVIIPALIKDKGKILNQMSLFWFNYTKSIIKNHIISSDIIEMPKSFQKEEFKDRTTLVKKVKILPYEFVIRGYIFGGMWRAYQEKGEYCGKKIIKNYQLAEKLSSPILTPSLKKGTGHDEEINIDTIINDLGQEMMKKIENICFQLYEKCSQYAYDKGIIIADTKLEFGFDEDNELILADEIFTPDSSRFWDLHEYEIGTSPKSYDKQFLRDWLLDHQINGEMQFNNIPVNVLEETSNLYKECIKRLCINE